MIGGSKCRGSSCGKAKDLLQVLLETMDRSVKAHQRYAELVLADTPKELIAEALCEIGQWEDAACSARQAVEDHQSEDCCSRKLAQSAVSGT